MQVGFAMRPAAAAAPAATDWTETVAEFAAGSLIGIVAVAGSVPEAHMRGCVAVAATEAGRMRPPHSASTEERFDSASS